MICRKVYVALPMDQSVVAALRVLKQLEINADDLRIAYQAGLTTVFVAHEKVGAALDGLVAARILTPDSAWDHFVSTPIDLH